jgi:hypothetical protein
MTIYCARRMKAAGQAPGARMDDETKALLRSIAHHLKWVIVLLLAILGMLIAGSLT